MNGHLKEPAGCCSKCEKNVRDRTPIGSGSSRFIMTGVHVECKKDDCPCHSTVPSGEKGNRIMTVGFGGPNAQKVTKVTYKDEVLYERDPAPKESGGLEVDPENIGPENNYRAARLHNAVQKVYEAGYAVPEQDNYGDARKEVFAAVNELLASTREAERENFEEILENNRDETLWGDKDSNEVMKVSIEAFIVAVKDELRSQ